MARQQSIRPSRSVRPSSALPASWQALRQIVRSHGGVEPGMLEAMLEEVPPERLEELVARSTAAELLERANRALVHADRTLRESSHQQRQKLRGFSTEMLALAADQAFRLGHMQERYTRALEEDARAKAGLQEALDGAVALIEQGSWVLNKVCVKDERVRRAIEANSASLAQHGSRAALLAGALQRLVRIAERVQRDGSVGVKTRARLFGLDGSYLESLVKMSIRITELDTQTRLGGEVPAAKKARDEAHAITAFLVEQIAEAFDTANKFDPTFPQLVPPMQQGPRPQDAPLSGVVRIAEPQNDIRVLGARIPVAARPTK